jgi:hypothetical protein
MDIPIQVFGSGWVTSDSLWFWTPINVFGSGRVPLDKVEGFVKGRDVLSGE